MTLRAQSRERAAPTKARLPVVVLACALLAACAGKKRDTQGETDARIVGSATPSDQQEPVPPTTALDPVQVRAAYSALLAGRMDEARRLFAAFGAAQRVLPARLSLVLVVFHVEGGGADAAAPAPASTPAAPAAAASAPVAEDPRPVPAAAAPAKSVTREEVERDLNGASAEPVLAEDAAPVAKAPAAPSPSRQPADERQPIRGLRKRVFEIMARSKRTAAHFHYVDEVDVAAITGLKDRAKPSAEKAGVKLTFLPFLVKAVVAALERHPRLNSVFDDAAMELVLRKTYDIGIATSTEAGLMVPVVRGCDRLSILEIASEIDRVARAARARKSPREDLGGSSFTITSLGRLGGLMAPPLLNYPEVGIMGVHAIKKKPIVRGDQIVIGEVMNLSFSFDHRVIDGDVGAKFAQEIISYLQEPNRLVVEMA